jgi:hypothetical protein
VDAPRLRREVDDREKPQYRGCGRGQAVCMHMHVHMQDMWWRSLAAPASDAAPSPRRHAYHAASVVPCQFVSELCQLLLVYSLLMSGFEIAGIVLGALPLIVYAFENLRDGASRLDRLVHFKEEYSKTWGEVEDEELMYRLQLLKLLRPLVNDGVLAKTELDALLLDTTSDAWKEPDLTIALKQRLGEAYQRYIANLEDIQQLAWQILQPLVQSSAFRQRINVDKVRSSYYDFILTR